MSGKDGLIVREISGGEEFKQFFELPWELYKDDPNWSPPLVSSRKLLLDKENNPAWSYLDGPYIGCWRSGQMVGTIVPYINHRHNDYAGEKIAWFGLFEALDSEVSRALLNAAISWAKQNGCYGIRGPQSFTTHEETGLLVENFSRTPILIPYNPPEYVDWIEDAGFTGSMNLISLKVDNSRTDLLPRIAKLSSRWMAKANVTVRNFDPKKKDKEFALIRWLYDEAWSKNFGFVGMIDAELDSMIEELGQFLDPKLTLFAEIDGKPVGFILAIPDFNEVFNNIKPRPGIPELWYLLRLVWHWKITKSIQWARVPLFGVIQEHREKGVDQVLLYHMMVALYESSYSHTDFSWILETNPLVAIGTKLGTIPYRTHRWYEIMF